MPQENPCCQVGSINPTDLPDSSGQQLRVAAIVPRPSRLSTWPTWQPSSEWDSPCSLVLRRSPIQVLTEPDVAQVQSRSHTRCALGQRCLPILPFYHCGWVSQWFASYIDSHNDLKRLGVPLYRSILRSPVKTVLVAIRSSWWSLDFIFERFLWRTEIKLFSHAVL